MSMLPRRLSARASNELRLHTSMERRATSMDLRTRSASDPTAPAPADASARSSVAVSRALLHWLRCPSMLPLRLLPRELPPRRLEPSRVMAPRCAGAHAVVARSSSGMRRLRGMRTICQSEVAAAVVLDDSALMADMADASAFSREVTMWSSEASAAATCASAAKLRAEVRGDTSATPSAAASAAAVAAAATVAASTAAAASAAAAAAAEATAPSPVSATVPTTRARSRWRRATVAASL
mmetsp:Transcript_35246/g.86481  ORF Transcript_35246/g.86481 Transcript_35246/m.86481 type:complete len:239 (+) Transcript_35246:256-972(+)